MSFRFALEAVLHYRQSLERQQELRLRAANQRVARARHVLNELDRQISDIAKQESRDIGSGVSAAELHFALLCRNSLQVQRSNIERELHRLEEFRSQQQSLFQQARQGRETLESLRERQRREYENELRRHEQRQLDDMFLLGRLRHKTS